MKASRCLLRVLLVSLWLASVPAYAQHDEDGGDRLAEHTEGHEFARHKVGVSFGYAYIREAVEVHAASSADAEQGVWVPSVGLDYRYRLSHKWLLGAVAEMETSDYLVVPKDLTRDKAFILAGLVSYEPVPFWEVYVGAGIELERHKNLAIFRIGTEYEFQLGTRGWTLSPVLLIDFKEGFETISMALALGQWL